MTWVGRKFEIAGAIGKPTEDEQREDAETAALHYVWNAYPDTLGKTSYAAVSLTRPPQSHGQTLTAPHSCRGTPAHRHREAIQNGEPLVRPNPLTDLHATGGRFPHDSDRPDCTSIRRRARLGVPAGCTQPSPSSTPPRSPH